MKKIPICLLLTFCLAIALVVVFISASQREHSHGMDYEVRVVNGFTDNSSVPLVIWCASKDSDLGGRALQEHDDFSWTARTNFWGDTSFSCTMKWDERRKTFEAFKVPRDTYRCGPFRRCFWMVREDGFFFSNDEVNWKMDFSWE